MHAFIHIIELLIKKKKTLSLHNRQSVKWNRVERVKVVNQSGKNCCIFNWKQNATHKKAFIVSLSHSSSAMFFSHLIHPFWNTIIYSDNWSEWKESSSFRSICVSEWRKTQIFIYYREKRYHTIYEREKKAKKKKKKLWKKFLFLIQHAYIYIVCVANLLVIW